MTVEKTETTDRPDFSARPARTGLTPPQVLTSGPAAASAAVVASFFGVAGTVIGAGLASVVTTVSAAVYGESLRRTNQRLQRLRRHPTPATVVAPLPQRLSPRRAPAPRRAPGRRPRWSR